MYKIFRTEFDRLNCFIFKAVNNRIIIVILLAVIVFPVFHSCREECPYKPRSLAGVDFHSVVDGTDQQSAVDSLSVRGLGREDSLFYRDRNNIRSMVLPVNGSAEESAFIIDVDKGTDTVWFSYRVIPRFLSPECGFVLNFELLNTGHTANIFDSVVIVTKDITSFDDTNIRIYH